MIKLKELKEKEFNLTYQKLSIKKTTLISFIPA